MIDIKKIDTDEDSLIKITHFLQESFPKNTKFTEEFVRWQYSLNPIGAMQGFNAWDGDKIVSHFAGLPIEMSLWGQNRRGLLCINVATNANYRGQKLFTKLGQKTIDFATDNGYDFMIAVPNANSTHAFLKYFEFQLISPLTVKIGIGNKIYSNKKFNCFKTWDKEQWTWRLSNPTNSYYYNNRGVISSPITFFLKTVSSSKLPDELANRYPNNIGTKLFNLYIGLGADTSKGLYFNIPSFIKRPPFNLVFKDLTGRIPTINKKDIFLQLIDLDTI